MHTYLSTVFDGKNGTKSFAKFLTDKTISMSRFVEAVPDILSQRTLHLAMTIVDHYCAAAQLVDTVRGHLFLIAGTALLVASKYEDGE
jgi:hypothetical protein